MPEMLKKLGIGSNDEVSAEYAAELDRLIYFRLVAQGLMDASACPDEMTADLAEEVRDRQRAVERGVEPRHCPVDERILGFLRDHLSDVATDIELPDPGITLDRHGIARRLSLPATGDKFENALVKSTRIANGVLHNPRHDRRTTKGTFHVVEGGLPVPAGKFAVPKSVFAKMLAHACRPPADISLLPFTSEMDEPAHTWVSLLLRPIVCPEVEGACAQRTMEVRFFVPGSLVSNLDFVESIFGNAGDPFLARNDAGLDVEHWTGHTGCVILAPHLSELTKKELGLPHVSEATERQKADGMCWEQEDEKYNNGGAFKLTCRTEDGVVVTLIADNYFGYCKKEVKTQISYAANLMGWCEEEHAGGTVAFPVYNIGDEFRVNSRRYNGRTFADVARDYAERIDIQPTGYGIDKLYPDVIYVPEDAIARMIDMSISWERDGQSHRIPLEPNKHYVAPSGYRFRLAKHPAAPTWRMVGTVGEGAVCHKPCTVSGGGKSEISKPLRDYMLFGPIFVADAESDFRLAGEILDRDDYHTRWKPDGPVPESVYADRPSRKVLDSSRSLGSVIKLLTPSEDYNDEYNAWLSGMPNYIFPIVYAIKRLQKPEWGDDWRSHFGVETVNGFPGHELRVNNRTVIGSYVRVGTDDSGAWRTFKLRQDYLPCEKLSLEDDITASVVLPVDWLTGLNPNFDPMSVKFVLNCEYRFFQRPDDAIHRGLDQNTEADLARDDNFISNFEPLTSEQARELTEDFIEFDQYTQPMQDRLRGAAERGEGYVVSSAHPRLVNGVPTKNPRYLQIRPDVLDEKKSYLLELGTRLFRAIPDGQPVQMPVNAVLLGRRNNPPDEAAGIRGLAVYNPIHYQELPELFMDFICSLTGKSPSTTGAGSEGALTKRPFNALRPATDLNNALVSYILTNLAGYSSSAGYVGPKVQVGHDISLLIPEVVARMGPEEIDPAYLIQNGLLEKLNDFDYEGQTILASRLGYRINKHFVRTFFARIFDNPNKVFTEAMLKPELQGMADYVDGIKNITEAQERVAKEYFDGNTPSAGGGVEAACPPLQALLHIMAFGDYNGMTAESPELREMFTLDHMLQSDWYQRRLATQQQRDTALWARHASYVQGVLNDPAYALEAQELSLADRLAYAQAQQAKAADPGYAASLRGALGADPLGQ